MNAIKTLKVTREFAVLGAAATGVTVVYTSVIYRLMEFLQPWAAYTLTGLIVLGVLGVIDFGVRQYLPYNFNLLINGTWKKSWKSKLFVLILSAVCLSQIYISMSISWAGRKDMTEAAMPAPDLRDEAGLTLQLSQATQSKLADINSDLDRLRQLKEVEVERIRKSMPESWAKVQSGSDPYGWHSRQIEKKVDKAVAPLDRDISELLDQKQRIREKETQLAEATVARAAASNAEKVEVYETRKSRNQYFLGWFGVGCSIMFVLSTFMIELSNSFQYDFEQHKTQNYGYSAITLTPTTSGKGPAMSRHAAPSPRTQRRANMPPLRANVSTQGPGEPNIEQVKNPNGPSREFEYLEGRVSKVESDVRDLRHTGNSPTLSPKPDRKPKSRSAQSTQKRKTTKAKLPIKKLKDRARRRWEREHPGWADIKKELEGRGVVVTEDRENNKLSLKGGK